MNFEHPAKAKILAPAGLPVPAAASSGLVQSRPFADPIAEAA